MSTSSDSLLYTLIHRCCLNNTYSVALAYSFQLYNTPYLSQELNKGHDLYFLLSFSFVPQHTYVVDG